MEKVALELFHSILFWLGDFLKTILFQVLARKSLDFVFFRGPRPPTRIRQQFGVPGERDLGREERGILI